MNSTNEKDNDKHSEEYDEIVPGEIFDIEDSDEMAEIYIDMFGL